MCVYFLGMDKNQIKSKAKVHIVVRWGSFDIRIWEVGERSEQDELIVVPGQVVELKSFPLK
jgi:hypothetical protein